MRDLVRCSVYPDEIARLEPSISINDNHDFLNDTLTGGATALRCNRIFLRRLEQLVQEYEAHGARRTTRTAHGARRTNDGARSTVHGARRTAHGARRTAHGARPTAHGARGARPTWHFWVGRKDYKISI